MIKTAERTHWFFLQALRKNYMMELQDNSLFIMNFNALTFKHFNFKKYERMK